MIERSCKTFGKYSVVSSEFQCLYYVAVLNRHVYVWWLISSLGFPDGHTHKVFII